MTTFFFDTFLKDEGRRGDLEVATDAMRRIGIPQLLNEMGADIAATISPDGAFRDAFLQGYRRAMRDLFFFREIYVEGTVNKPPVTFNAIDRLVKDGTITEHEAKTIRERKLNGPGIN